jgi:hypothetical protein
MLLVKGEPQTLGEGFGAALADYLPLMPTGARRAGAARLMAERIGEDPSMLVKHPILTQLAALAAGGAMASNSNDRLRAAALALLPLAATQMMRRSEIQGIDAKYKATKKKKRLQDLEGDALGAWGGSAQLGARRAYETMRKRQPVELSATAEAADAIPLIFNSTPLAPLSLPITDVIDRLESRRIKNAGALGQDNAPVIPATLVAALAGSLGRDMASEALHNGLVGDSALPRDQWQGLVKHVSGVNPLLLQMAGSNAGHLAPEHAGDLAASYGLNVLQEGVLRDDMKDRGLISSILGDPMSAARDKARRGGLILAGKGPYSSAQVLAHEAGHARIENTPGALRFAQRHLYPLASITAPLTSAGSMVAGLKSKSALKGALLGTLIGTVGNAGIMAPEFMASYHALKGLKGYEGGRLAQSGQTADLVRALSTYAAGNVLPSTLSGLVGGFISSRRNR